MSHLHLRTTFIQLVLVACLTACTTPNRQYHPDGGPADGPDGVGDAPPGSSCTANQVLRCDGSKLVRCSAEGTEVSDACPAGCNATELRCADIVPSNNLASFLDLTSSQLDINLSDSATINTDTGQVVIGGSPINVNSGTIDQAGAPTIRVFIVHSLTTNDVVVTGKNALAVVSNGDIKINGVFSASGQSNTLGPGGFIDNSCQGGNAQALTGAEPGAGGGGFGSVGGNGGSATSGSGHRSGSVGGSTTGNASLIPLRGGCDGGRDAINMVAGGGGGAIQLVSRSQILIANVGKLAANGKSAYGGGGSGGGILLEAPTVQVSGSLVANGGGGGGGWFSQLGENGRLDAMPAQGGAALTFLGGMADSGKGGNGGARNVEATNGDSVDEGQAQKSAFAGNGGGGYGRIRVNTASGSLQGNGVISPTPSMGPIATH